MRRVVPIGFERLREPPRPLGERAVELADDVAALESRINSPGPDVGAAPLDQAGQQVALPDHRLDVVLDQAVAERDERFDLAPLDQWRDDRVQRRLDGDQREVELALELVDAPHRLAP